MPGTLKGVARVAARVVARAVEPRAMGVEARAGAGAGAVLHAQNMYTGSEASIVCARCSGNAPSAGGPVLAPAAP